MILKVELVIVFVALSLFAVAQPRLMDRQIEWHGLQAVQISDRTTITEWVFTGASRNNETGLPEYSEVIALPGVAASADVKVRLLEVTELESKENEALSGQIIPSSVQFSYAVSQSRGKPYLVFNMLPFVSNQGIISKVLRFEIEVNIQSKINRSGGNGPRTFVSNSVMQSGSWFKMGITQTGIYKIDFAKLQSFGIDVGSLNPATINIYGNGMGMLPERNADFRRDDLYPNAIYVAGEADGSFDAGDYILFYGVGPNSWSYDTTDKRFVHQNHLYSDTSYYFIGIGAGPPKRVSTLLSSTLSPTRTITSFDDYAYHEADLENLLKSGREWYGEFFDIVTSYSFNFNFPYPNTAKNAVLKYSLCANTVANGNINSFTSSYLLSIGSQMSHSVVIPGITPGDYAAEGRMAEGIVAFSPTSSSMPVTVSFTKNASSSKGWLNYIELHVRRDLVHAAAQMGFRDVESFGPGEVGRFEVSGASSAMSIWDVTDPTNAQSVSYSLSGSLASFTLPIDTLRQFISFDGTTFLTPKNAGAIPNQNLHGVSPQNMLIVSHPLFLDAANELADIHRAEGLSVLVVTTTAVYNEFSSGMKDITAIKDFTKMFYDRAAGDTTRIPRFLLLFGDGSYDNKNRIAGNSSYIPTFESASSLEVLSSYVSDDYFGLLDDSESNLPSDLIDIGIGRMAVRTVQEAQNAVSKIKRYLGLIPPATAADGCDDRSSAASSDWLNMICFVADDEDGNTHIGQADVLSAQVYAKAPAYNQDKIYIDAYKQISTPGGQRYPEAVQALKQRVQKGAFVINYTGHGGEVGWAHEAILDVGTIQGWTNNDRLPVFVTATCEFSRYDDPERVSAGEYVFLNNNGGGIALLTTTRLTFSGENLKLNKNFYNNLWSKYGNQFVRLGDIARLTKVQTTSGSGNHRNFSLLGDPALMLRYPQHNVVATTINGKAMTTVTDTLRALSRVTVTGQVENSSGQKLDNFKGVVYPTVYDKAVAFKTLANDGGASYSFNLQKNALYKGKASVTDGSFSFSFVVPKDINYQFGAGRMSFYAESETADALGYDERFYVGGTDPNPITDLEGPTVDLYMNDDNFVSGGLTDENPVLLAHLFDENGINTVGTGIGHDLSVVLDRETSKVIVLNDYYQSNLDTYQSGEVAYPFFDLEPGIHTVDFKVWDVFNNSSEKSLDFLVAESDKLAIDHLLNYPNPFTTSTEFFFEHNQICNSLEVMIHVFTVSGKLVKSIGADVHTNGFRVEGIPWNGRDEYGDQLARGVYVYRVEVLSPSGDKAQEIQKLVLLR